jgi:hypothetical protein
MFRTVVGGRQYEQHWRADGEGEAAVSLRRTKPIVVPIGLRRFCETNPRSAARGGTRQNEAISRNALVRTRSLPSGSDDGSFLRNEANHRIWEPHHARRPPTKRAEQTHWSDDGPPSKTRRTNPPAKRRPKAEMRRTNPPARDGENPVRHLVSPISTGGYQSPRKFTTVRVTS